MTEESKQVENIGAGKETTPAAQQPLTTASINTPAGSTPSSKPQGAPLVCRRYIYSQPGIIRSLNLVTIP